MQLFDTHAHLDHQQFKGQLDDVRARWLKADLGGVLAMATTVQSSRDAIDIAERFDDVYAAVGIQPTLVGKPQSGCFDEIVELAKHPRVKAIGETGLDAYWDDNAPMSQQCEMFDQHIALSQQTGLPFIVHMRNTDDEILQRLQQAARKGALAGVMHSFTGTWELAKACMDLGLYISFAGMVTFKNSAALRSVAERIPDDRILIETDAPYLTPHPYRSKKPNEPHYVRCTAQCLADLRRTRLEQFAEQTTENARRLFAIDP